jgi:ABC-type dipeptide/oligopeptide/nickel transport system permease component
MLEVLGQDYVRTARSKGLAEAAVVWRHALRNALIPTVTIVGLQFGYMLGGAVLVEVVFAWPGLGRYLVQSIASRDYPAVQGVVLVVTAGYVLVNLLVDLACGALDPRIRHGA